MQQVYSTQVHLELGPEPASLTCPYCHQHITTVTNHEMGVWTMCLCCWMFFFTSILFSWTVCLCNFSKDVSHSCPSCNKKLGTYARPFNATIAIFAVVMLLIGVGGALAIYFIASSQNSN